MARPVIKMPSLLLVAVWLAVLGKPSSCAPMQGFNPLAREVEGFLSEPIEGAGSFASNAVETYSHQPRHYHSFDDPNEVYLQAAHHSAPFDAGTPRSYQSYPETRHGAYYGGPMNAPATYSPSDSSIDSLELGHINVHPPAYRSQQPNFWRAGEDHYWASHVQDGIARRGNGLPLHPAPHGDIPSIPSDDHVFLRGKGSQLQRGYRTISRLDAERRVIEERVKGVDGKTTGISWFKVPPTEEANVMEQTRVHRPESGADFHGPFQATMPFRLNDYEVRFRYIPREDVPRILGRSQHISSRMNEWWFHVAAFPMQPGADIKNLGLMKLTLSG